MDIHAWKEIPDGPITLDFSGCRHWYEVHPLVKETFGFPEHYGNNLDALWDCMREFAGDEETRRDVYVRGFAARPQEIRELCLEIIRVLKKIEKKYPLVHFIIEE